MLAQLALLCSSQAYYPLTHGLCVKGQDEVHAPASPTDKRICLQSSGYYTALAPWPSLCACAKPGGGADLAKRGLVGSGACPEGQTDTRQRDLFGMYCAVDRAPPGGYHAAAGPAAGEPTEHGCRCLAAWRILTTDYYCAPQANVTYSGCGLPTPVCDGDRGMDDAGGPDWPSWCYTAGDCVCRAPRPPRCPRSRAGVVHYCECDNDDRESKLRRARAIPRGHN
jgi:hypothetical protein